jgi:hypothetical protein
VKRLSQNKNGDLNLFYLVKSQRDGIPESFTKWLPGMLPTFLQLMDEVHGCTSGPFSRKCHINDCTALYFSQIESGNILKLPCIL